MVGLYILILLISSTTNNGDKLAFCVPIGTYTKLHCSKLEANLKKVNKQAHSSSFRSLPGKNNAWCKYFPSVIEFSFFPLPRCNL